MTEQKGQGDAPGEGPGEVPGEGLRVSPGETPVEGSGEAPGEALGVVPGEAKNELQHKDQDEAQDRPEVPTDETIQPRKITADSKEQRSDTDSQLPELTHSDPATPDTLSPEHHLPTSEVDWPGSVPYNFRKNVQFDPAILSGVGADHDATDNYDPDLSDDCENYAPARKTLRWDLGSYTRPKPIYTPREKIASYQFGRCRGLQSHVVLRLSKIAKDAWRKEEGKKVAQILAQWTNNWPEDHGDHPVANFTELNIDSIRNGRLRNRDSSQSAFNESRWLNEFGKWKEVTLGNPAYRGCKACYEIGLDCELIKGAKYPCEQCLTDGVSCMLIIEPTSKNRCEMCMKRRITCSYQNTEDHRGPCENCNASDFVCIAGPRGGYTRQGPSLDGPPAAEGAKKVGLSHRGRSKHCDQCRNAQARCSFPKSRTPTTCSRCRQEGLACTATKGSDELPNPEREHSPEIGFLSSQPTPLSHKVYGEHVEFEAATDPEGPRKCDWCRDEAVGLIGRSTRSTCSTSECTAETWRMCCTCTMLRLRILLCDHQEFAPIPESEVPDLAQGAVDFLLKQGLASLASWKWCAVCRKPARHRCTHGEAEDMRMFDGASEHCGLHLCEGCHAGLAVGCGGNLTAYICQLEVMRDTNLRADANFLRRDGFMVRKMTRARA